MSASFEVSLEDSVSPAAKSAKASVASLSEEFAKLQKDLQKDGKEFFPSVADQKKEAAETKQWFADLQRQSATADDHLLGFQTQLIEVYNAALPVVAVLAAISAGLGQLALMSIRLTQEKDALRATFDVFTNGAGDKLLGELEDLSAELPFTADKLNAWAKSMLAAGIKGEQLRTSIRAVAAATAIMGESGGAAAEGLIKRFALMAETGQKVKLDRRILNQLAEAGVSVQALAKALGVAPDKLGKMELGAKDLGKAMQQALIQQGKKPLEAMGQTWASISAKLREGFEDAFEDLGDLVTPFMRELQSLASEFFAGGIAGNSWKDTIKNVMRVVFEVGSRTVRALHIGFLELEVAWLKAKIALKPISSALDKIGISAGIVNVIMYLIAGTAITLAVIFGVLAAAVLICALPFIIIGLAIYGIIAGITYLVDLITSAVENFDQLEAAAGRAGQGIIDGLGNAIANGTAWVVGLIKSLALQIVQGIVGPLQIKSPSRVMMRLGAYTTQGLAEGITAGQGEVVAAAAGAGGAAVGGAAAGVARGSGGGGVTIHVEAGAVVIQGAGGDIKALTRDALALVLEEAALQAGIA